MQVSIDDFWQLLAASELLSSAECETLRSSFAQLKGAGQRASAPLLAEWLVAERKLTRYQADVLLAGRPGPFVLGPFTVVDRIAKGRLERVFRATYEGQPVMFLPLVELTNDPDEYGQYGELATLCAAVKSPHVTRTYRATRQRGQALVVFESLSGHTLIEAIAGKQLPVPTACQLGMQLALGLVAIHERALIHGSIAPQNVWVTPQGSLKLMQFPLVAPAARARSFDMPLADYVAPELLERRALPNALTDIYSLGCVVYELIAGRPPFAGGGPQQKLARHKSEFPKRLDSFVPKVPDDLAQIVEDMLAKDPLLRCQTANEAAHILGRFAAAGRAAPPPGSAGLTPGYGAWQATAWAEPPQQAGALTPKPPRASPSPEPKSSAPDTAPAISEKTKRAASKPQAATLKVTAPTAPVAKQQRAATTSPAPSIVIEVPDASVSGGANRGSDVPFVVTEPTGSAVRSPRKPSSPPGLKWAIGAAAAALLILVIGVVWSQRSGEEPVPPTAAPPVPASTENAAPTEASAPPLETTTSNLIEDDGRTLWESPTDGAPLELRYLPSGAQVILVLRPADLLASDEGPKLIDALGPAGESLTANLERTLGIPLADVEQLVVAFAADESLVPRASYVATLAGDADQQSLLKAWGDPTPAEHAGKQYFERDGLAYYLPEADGGRTVAISTAAWMPEILDLEGPPLLRSSLQQLLAASDSQRTFTLLAAPSFVFTDGSSLLQGPLAQLLTPLRTFLGPDLEAVSLSAHLDTDLYLEFRARAPVERKPLELLAEIRARWEQLPEQIETQLGAIPPRSYGADVLRQFPAMLKEARSYTRSGVVDRQIVLSAYLPGAAAHNLVLGADLALLEMSPHSQPQSEAVVATQTVSAEEALARKVTLSFPRETLEGALGILAREIELPIVIQGNDLQLEGITRNQSLTDFDARQQPAADVLRQLLLLANPDGKLVYQVKADAAGSCTIFVTTRSAVNRRGEQPAEGL